MIPACVPSKRWKIAKYPVLLTFDDGPDVSVTPRILEVLDAYQIRAIFFVVGQRLYDRENRALLERILSVGHLVGNHSYSHVDLATVNRDRVSAEIESTQEILISLGVRERMFRPPFGSLNQNVIEIVRTQSMWGIGWTCDTLDWDPHWQPDSWIINGVQQVNRSKESIVLMHDIHATTWRGLKRFIDQLLKLGRSFPPLFCDEADSFPFELTWKPGFEGWQNIEDLPIYRPIATDMGLEAHNEDRK